MTIALYQIDAFAEEVFQGNPAAVCPLGEWLTDERMQAIAAESNLSETAFFVPGAGPGEYDLRFFAPALGIDEDPVTGSAHCTLTPYWAERLGKTELHARQVSARGGELYCRAMGERVRIAGRARLYLEGTIQL
jgi:predicted PhzF superfamily epimerase YddE/YHI9